jgi:hypothetical protein
VFSKESVGKFWPYPIFPYIKAKFDSALLLRQTAFNYNVTWNRYDFGMREKFLMFLLNIDRDDDAYAFCRYFIRG